MKRTLWLSFLLLFSVNLFYGCSDKGPAGADKAIPGIIFDTDMGPDYDDAGAISVLHALAANNECKILATVASNRAPYTAPAIEVFNRYFGHPDIPVGVPVAGGPDISPANHWTDSLAFKYLPSVKTNENYPDAVSVYRKILAGQPDNSVVIVTVGFVTNLEALLKSGADSASPLSGPDLVRKKVRKYVPMAGKFPEGREFNVFADSSASVYVFTHWPTPVLFSGFEIGEKILTGGRIAASNVKSPGQWAYHYCLETYAKQPVKNRNSWDQTAVLCAIRDPEKYFYVSGNGTFICNPDGTNSWDPEKEGNHQFLIHKYPYRIIAGQIEDLMMYQPGRKQE